MAMGKTLKELFSTHSLTAQSQNRAESGPVSRGKDWVVCICSCGEYTVWPGTWHFIGQLVNTRISLSPCAATACIPDVTLHTYMVTA